MGEATKASDPSEARKRRKAIMESQRKEADAASNNNQRNNNGNSSDADEEQRDIDADGAAKKGGRKRKNTNNNTNDSDANNKRAQIRYDPDVPMSKEQLAAWRREARRVRNRESAAASRQRIRNRITELEGEVEEWKSKFDTAMDRLRELQAQQEQESTTANLATGASELANEKEESAVADSTGNPSGNSSSSTTPQQKTTPLDGAAGASERTEGDPLPPSIPTTIAKPGIDNSAIASSTARTDNNSTEPQENQRTTETKADDADCQLEEEPGPEQLAAAAALAQAAVAAVLDVE